MPVGPPVPPKPSTPILNGERLGEYGVDNVPERRGILPASLREKINQKKELEGRATPSIEPDLVGRDRYDKASRCFSYVPAKSMQEAFERPRRTSFSRAIEKRENSVENISHEEVARSTIPQSYQQQDINTPMKWDDQVEDAKQAALLEELARAPSAMQHNYWGGSGRDQDEIDNVQVVEQAQRAVITPTSTLQRKPKPPARSGSYRTLNDDAYCSDMDELCDPEYYLNFNSNTAPVPPPRHQHAGTRSVQLPRKKMNFDAVTDPLDDVLESTKRLGSAYSVGDVRQNGQDSQQKNNDFNFSNTLNNTPTDYRQHYRNRNCQSVTTPRNNHFSSAREQESDAADSWLSGKLKKVRSKRDIDPDIVRRRTQEKMLLEELKDSAANNDENQQQLPNGHYRGGNQNIDPLAEFRREEERLRNTRSPYGEERWRGRMRGKPPTPPPRESSASPVNSLARGTPSSHLENSRQRHNQSVPLPMHHRQFDEDFDVNSLLNFSHDPRQQSNTLERGGRSLSRGARIQDAYYASQQDLSANNRFYSGQERVAAAIYRAETPHRDIYASGTINRAETPGRYFPENSAVLERSSTPSFPVSRATPLPFHPLLYNNGERERGVGGPNGYSTMNNRSASPRHFGGSSTLSRRSSVNSVGKIFMNSWDWDSPKTVTKSQNF
ncbi:CRE-TAG-163 protein [Caenorhabditis remanei]|uniref:CRE-TAG-163 protein n=1 Tax=Caenorhabditis remanei TaxID=31234 RepID=E3LXE5_CAERE|nr:CRE-TAG-163 protein [Caenorhabditis remanei]